MSRVLLDEMALGDTSSVLDLATGVGTLLPELQRRAPGARVAGVDVAEGMVRMTPEGFPVAVMDAMGLGFRAGSFDAAVVAFALFHFPDPEGALREVHRVLQPGGLLGTVTWGDDPGYVAYEIWNEELDRFGAPPPDVVMSRHELVESPAKVSDLLARTGFEVIDCWTGIYEKTMTPQEFVDHRIGHGLSRKRFTSLPHSAVAPFLQALSERLERLDAEELTDRSEVVYGSARRGWPAREHLAAGHVDVS